MLILPIKQKWFNMILSGEKPEEYREIKPYWIRRILNVMGFPEEHWEDIKECLIKMNTLRDFDVLFRNGYGNCVPEFIAECSISIGRGREEWGAVPGEDYFIFHIHKIRWSAPRKK